MAYSLAFHIIGICLWLGGMMVLTRLTKIYAQNGCLKESGAGLLRSYYGFVVPGLLIASMSGLYQISSVGFSHYMQQGWFHVKLTLVLLLFVLSALVGRNIAAAAKGDGVAGLKAGKLHAAVGMFLVVIVFLTIVGRTAN